MLIQFRRPAAAGVWAEGGPPPGGSWRAPAAGSARAGRWRAGRAAQLKIASAGRPTWGRRRKCRKLRRRQLSRLGHASGARWPSAAGYATGGRAGASKSGNEPADMCSPGTSVAPARQLHLLAASWRRRQLRHRRPGNRRPKPDPAAHTARQAYGPALAATTWPHFGHFQAPARLPRRRSKSAGKCLRAAPEPGRPLADGTRPFA